MLVQQQVKAHLPFGLNGLQTVLLLFLFITVLINGIVMIAQHSIDAIFGLQLPETGYMRGQLVRIYVLHITCKHNHVCLLGIDAADGPLQQRLPFAYISTHVGIGEMHDTIAVEGFGQVAAGKLDVPHL